LVRILPTRPLLAIAPPKNELDAEMGLRDLLIAAWKIMNITIATPIKSGIHRHPFDRANRCAEVIGNSGKMAPQGL